MPGDALATIRGLPSFPSITEVNVREAASTSTPIAFRVPVGMSGLDILEIQPDSQGMHFEGKVYTWFKLRFHGGAVGWVRDDLLNVQGDLRAFGYPDLSTTTFAFMLQRNTSTTSSVNTTTTPTSPITPIGVRTESQPTTPDTPTSFKLAPDDVERVRRVSFQITSAFEGRGYSAYQNIDAGIVSYGFIQFTLGAGSLATVLGLYLSRSQSDTANRLRGYQERVIARDATLRTDTTLRDLLIAAADEPAMREAQDSVATNGFWKAVVDGYIIQRELKLPLMWALLFDMGVNFGVNHSFVRLAERDLNVPERSKPGQNGITEEQLATRIAQLRKMSHDRQADRDNLPGLRRRGDFWMNLVTQGDWGLQGDTNGNVNANGRIIKVRS